MVFRLVFAVLAVAFGLAAAPPPPQDWLVSQSSQCQQAIQTAEARYKLPHGLLDAIARTESGRPITGLGDIRAWPWTIDADGQGLFLDSKAAAMAWVRQAVKRGAHYIDVGCMQVDLEIHPDAFATLDDAFDPGHNVDYAARYLLSLHAEAKGDWNLAVGLYHSHTPELAADYRDRVALVGKGIVSGIGGPEPLYVRAMRQGTLRLALAGGGRLVLHIRQPGRRPKHLNTCQVERELGSYLSPKVRSQCRQKTTQR